MGSLDLNRDYFELFGLSDSFEIDTRNLAERYRELQAQTHPDRYAGGSDVERRVSLQQSALINEAYQTLKSPLTRARYLLRLRGGEISDTDTAMDPEFLMQQMELRESLDAIRGEGDVARLQELQRDIASSITGLERELGELFAEGAGMDLETAGDRVRRLQFMVKLRSEAESLEDELT